MIFAPFSYWLIFRLRLNRVLIPRALSFYSFVFLLSTGLFPRGETLFHCRFIIIVEFTPHSKIILRQLKNLSQPKVLVGSTKLFKDNFKICPSQNSSSLQRNYSKTVLRPVLPRCLLHRANLLALGFSPNDPIGFRPKLKGHVTIWL